MCITQSERVCDKGSIKREWLFIICNKYVTFSLSNSPWYSIIISYNMLSVFLVSFQNSIFLHTLCFVFLLRSILFYNKYVLFTCTCLYVYKYVYSWAYCPMYKGNKLLNCNVIFMWKHCNKIMIEIPNTGQLFVQISGSSAYIGIIISDIQGSTYRARHDYLSISCIVWLLFVFI